MKWQLHPASVVYSFLILLASLGFAGCLDTLTPGSLETAGGDPIGPGPGDDDDDDDVINDPEPPPVDPDGDIAVGGYVYQEGFWRGWRADSQRNYTEVDGHGAMGTNASAIRYIGADEDGAGSFSFKVFFNHADQMNLFGGRHLAGVASNSLAFRPRDADGRRYPWDTTRIDLDRPSDGRIRGHLYSWIGDELYEETYWYSVPFELGQWAQVNLQWRQTGDRLEITVNGDSHTFNLLPRAPKLGTYLYFGNMDNITGVIEFDDIVYRQ
jgi:hypothetical protein